MKPKVYAKNRATGVGATNNWLKERWMEDNLQRKAWLLSSTYAIIVTRVQYAHACMYIQSSHACMLLYKGMAINLIGILNICIHTYRLIMNPINSWYINTLEYLYFKINKSASSCNVYGNLWFSSQKKMVSCWIAMHFC